MNFKFFYRWLSQATWQRKLTEIMAKLAVEYNSYYQRIYTFRELLLQEPMQLLVSTQFVEGRVRFKHASALPVLAWETDFETLQKMDLKYIEIFKSQFSPKNSKVRILIPEPLAEHFEEIITSLKSFESTLQSKGSVWSQLKNSIRFQRDVGIITSSGRSFWVGWHAATSFERPFCFKIDTLEILTARDYINYRRLSPEDAKLAVLINDLLEKILQEKNNHKNFLNENLAVHLQSQKTDHTRRYVTLERQIDFKRCNIQRGDFLIGMQVLLSPDFWQTKKNLRVIGIRGTNLGDYFSEHLVRGFAELIRNSVEHTFLHFEIHQQNLTCHLRKGHLQQILVHDLQDTIFDPVSFLMSSARAQWPEKLKQISQLYKVRFFNFYGEQRLNIKNHSHYFVPGSFYRRYFRNFGNYTRIFNQASGEDYLFSRKLEALVVRQLNYSEEELGLDGPEGKKIKDARNYLFLREHLFWIISRRIWVKQQKMLEQIFACDHEKNILNDTEQQALILRAQREVCFFSANLPDRMNLTRCQILKTYRLFEDKIYFLLLKNGQLAALIFIQTIGIC